MVVGILLTHPVLWFGCATSPQAQVFKTWSPASCAVWEGCQTTGNGWSLVGGSGSLGVGLPYFLFILCFLSVDAM